MNSVFSIHSISVASIAALLCLGCGPSAPTKPTGSVSGKITYKGAAVKDVMISFVDPAQAGASGGGPVADGAYTVNALAAGDYEVSLSPASPPPAATQGGALTMPAPITRSDLPAKYLSGKTSGLKVTVKKDATTPFDIDMKD